MTEKVYRVSPGGLFHTHKVKYSSETESFIRDLIKESKLSIFQRKKVEDSVKNGEPLPLPPTKTARGISQQKPREQPKNVLPRRRKKEDIQLSGAYNRDMFIPTYLKANHDVEKTKLQEVMAFGRTLKSGKQRKAPESLQFKDQDEIKFEDGKLSSITKKTALDEIADEIDERKQFLTKMEAAGQGKHYREIITQEIQEKLRLADNILSKKKKN